MTIENQVNRFTTQINAIIGILKIDKQEFFNDVNQLKSNQLGINSFKSKYSELFNGTIAKFKNKESFLGSYYRNINPNYFTQSQSKNIQEFNREFRFETLDKPKIDKQNAKRKIIKKSRIRLYSKTELREKITYFGFAKHQITLLDNIWNLQHIKNNKLVGYQEVIIKIKASTFDSNGNCIIKAHWWSFTGGVSRNDSLNWLYNQSYQLFLEWLFLLDQSNLIIKIEKVLTEVYRIGN